MRALGLERDGAGTDERGLCRKNLEGVLPMPAMVTKQVAGLGMYGQFVAFGFVPRDDKTDAGEKYYIQITAPNLTSNKARMTDECYIAFSSVCGKEGENLMMGAPVLLDVRPMVFKDVQYWQATGFHLRPDNTYPFDFPPVKLPPVGGAFGASSASGPMSASSSSGSGVPGVPKSGKS